MHGFHFVASVSGSHNTLSGNWLYLPIRGEKVSCVTTHAACSQVTFVKFQDIPSKAYRFLKSLHISL